MSVEGGAGGQGWEEEGKKRAEGRASTEPRLALEPSQIPVQAQGTPSIPKAHINQNLHSTTERPLILANMPLRRP